MPPSQLKRLKASLREQGIVGPQKSKQQKKQTAKGSISKDKKVKRNVALQGIRDQFNPFEVKMPARKNKYEFVNGGDRAKSAAITRPGLTKGLGEETRRKTLLVEMQRRQKVGGITDRRFGEDDPTIAPEEKALERFVKEKQLGGRRGTLFDLEDDDADEGEELTHLGRSLSFKSGQAKDDFEGEGLSMSGGDDVETEGELRSRKRRRLLGSAEDPDPERDSVSVPEYPKTKQEIMKEVIAKSKFHKYERQKAKEDDEELREELDQGLSDIYALMRNKETKDKETKAVAATTAVIRQPVVAESMINPDRAALLNGKDRSKADKEYDERLRQMAFEARAQPTAKTKTKEEKLEEDARRLKDLEDKRLLRMRGVDVDHDMASDGGKSGLEGDENVDPTEEYAVGLGGGIPAEVSRIELGVEDEDEFLLDDDLLATAPGELSESDHDSSDEPLDMSSNDDDDDDEENEFVLGLLSSEDAGRSGLRTDQTVTGSNNAPVSQRSNTAPSVAFAYSCPQTREELSQITAGMSINEFLTAIQGIRALYHPKLASDNKAKLGVFSTVLVDYLSYIVNQDVHPPFAVLEAIIRHIHSLAKMVPENVGLVFRRHLRSIQEQRPNALTAGDLIILTAIGSIFPTSDHFHQVVTPAVLTMGRYLGQKIPRTLGEIAKATYIATLCVQYQRLSKRYIPELVNHALHIVAMLAPIKNSVPFGYSPQHESEEGLRIGSMKVPKIPNTRRLNFWDIKHQAGKDILQDEQLKLALLNTQILLIDAMADLWVSKSAFIEIFTPFSAALTHLSTSACARKLPIPFKTTLHSTLTKINNHLQQMHLTRQPLHLHNHRPLAIKTSIPKYEESYNPDKHYDPDHDRADMSKLKAEHKRERKGALRELRKDANFVARESLREKKERDSAYEKKYKRLVAEIQGEEGREANAYEREKGKRKSSRR